MKYVTTIGGNEYQVEITTEGQIKVDGVEYEIDLRQIGDQPVYSLLINGKSYEAYVHPAEKAWQVLLLGNFFNSQVEDERERRLRLASGGIVSERLEYYLKAPMPGLVVDVPVQEGQQVEKGDVLGVAQVAGIMASKRTYDLIPMCHPLNITSVNMEFLPKQELSQIEVKATAKIVGRTGIEMEALVAVSAASLTIYDMCKAVDREMTISDIRLLKKSGGKSGTFKRA